MAHLSQNKVFDKPSPAYDGCTITTGPLRMHIRALPPVFFWSDQLQPDLVFKHMRRRIDLNMHSPPKGTPPRRTVRNRDWVVGHKLPLKNDLSRSLPNQASSISPASKKLLMHQKFAR